MTSKLLTLQSNLQQQFQIEYLQWLLHPLHYGHELHWKFEQKRLYQIKWGNRY